MTFREQDAVSSDVLCFGKLLECGWGVDGHRTSVESPCNWNQVPKELRNKSMMVRGWIRMVGATVSPLMKL